MRPRWRTIVGVMLVGLVATAAPSPARACSGPPTRVPVGIPRAGATGVSTATSIVVLSVVQPTGLALQADGQDVALSEPVRIDWGADGLISRTAFWRVRPAAVDGMLRASAEHVLTAKFEGNTVEVTRFTTAAGYDKAEGVAPVAHGLRLWRVRYPLSDIQSGNCVGAEYHGFLAVDYDPAIVPNTPPASVVHTFQLAPKTGGTAQTFIYTGDTPFGGLAPQGDHPLPIGDWQPELDPTREYCLTISAFGDGDIARLPLSSQAICAKVNQLSASGAPASPTIDGGGGGCAVSGRAGTSLPVLLGFALAFGASRRPHRLNRFRWRSRFLAIPSRLDRR